MERLSIEEWLKTKQKVNVKILELENELSDLRSCLRSSCPFQVGDLIEFEGEKCFIVTSGFFGKFGLKLPKKDLSSASNRWFAYRFEEHDWHKAKLIKPKSE